MFLAAAPLARLRDCATPSSLLAGLATVDGITVDTLFVSLVDEEGRLFREPLHAVQRLIAWEIISLTRDGRPAAAFLEVLIQRYETQGGAYDPNGELLARAEAALAAARAA